MSYRVNREIKGKQKMLDSFERIMGSQRNMLAYDLTFMDSLNII